MRFKLFFLFVLAMCVITPNISFAQQDADNKTVTLVVSGEGSTKEEATKNALRSAIEQAFGTFVSANTSVIDDELVRDEIATVTSGNIQNYKEVSSTDVDGVKNVTLQATVAIGKLVSYAQNKGMTAELAGATFAMNKKMHLLNVQNEMRAIEILKRQMLLMSNGLFDYEIKTKEPYDYDDSVRIDFSIVFKANKNTINYFSSISNVLNSLCLTESEKEEYKKARRQIYNVYFPTFQYAPIGMHKKSLEGKNFYFRSEFSKGGLARIFVEPTLRNFAVVDNLGNNEKIKINWKEAFSDRRKFLKSSGKLRTPYESSYVAEHLYYIFEYNVINNPKEGDVLYTLEHLHMMYSNDEIEKLQSLQVVPADRDYIEVVIDYNKENTPKVGIIEDPTSYFRGKGGFLRQDKDDNVYLIQPDYVARIKNFQDVKCLLVYNGAQKDKESYENYHRINKFVIRECDEDGNVGKVLAAGKLKDSPEAQYIKLPQISKPAYAYVLQVLSKHSSNKYAAHAISNILFCTDENNIVTTFQNDVEGEEGLRKQGLMD